MAETIHLKKAFLITLIISLIVSAIIGVVIFLIGNFSETEKKLLWTTGLISGFSLVGLFISWFYEEGKFEPLPIAALPYIVLAFLSSIVFIWGSRTAYQQPLFKLAFTILALGSLFFWGIIFYYFFKQKKLLLFTGGGLILLVLGFIFKTMSIWEVIDQKNYLKLWLTIFILFFSILHISLLWLVRKDNLIVNISLFFTIAMVVIVAGLLITLVMVERGNLPELFFRILGAFAILDGVGTVVTPITRKVVSLHHNNTDSHQIPKRNRKN